MVTTDVVDVSLIDVESERTRVVRGEYARCVHTPCHTRESTRTDRVRDALIQLGGVFVRLATICVEDELSRENALAWRTGVVRVHVARCFCLGEEKTSVHTVL